MNLRLACLALFFLAGPVAADATWTSRDGHFHVTVESEIDPIVINRIHRWLLDIRDADGNAVGGANITVDGGMPAHDHGLPTRPRVTAEPAPGQYVLEGLRFHMRGHWELQLTIEAGGIQDLVVISVDL